MKLRSLTQYREFSLLLEYPDFLRLLHEFSLKIAEEVSPSRLIKFAKAILSPDFARTLSQILILRVTLLYQYGTPESFHQPVFKSIRVSLAPLQSLRECEFDVQVRIKEVTCIFYL